MADNDLLYHYTTADALDSILTTMVLRAMDVRFLNDSSELTFLGDRLVRALTAAAEDAEAQTPPDLNLSSGLRQFAESAAHGPHSGHMFVTCFCGDGDLLSQWRGYPGVQGYAIGFDPNELAASKRPFLTDPAGQGPTDQLELQMLKIKYGDAPANDILARLMDEYRGIAGQGDGGSTWMFALQRMTREMAQIKHGGFVEEQETRLAICPGEGWYHGVLCPSHFVRRGMFVPFLPIKVPPGAIKKIVLGPGHKRQWPLDSQVQVLEDALRYHWKLDGVVVERSRTPLI